MEEIEWDRFLEKLLIETNQAIDKFALEHPNEEVCYFAYDTEPCYGYVLTCFNTTESSIKHVSEWHKRNIKYCGELLDDDVWRNSAYYQVKANSVLPYCDNTGDFEYQGFTEINFPEWEKYANSENYPEPPSHEDDYLESRVALIFWKALQKLSDDGAFTKLNMATPTLLGFGYHDDDPVVVRMLNVPNNA